LSGEVPLLIVMAWYPRASSTRPFDDDVVVASCDQASAPGSKSQVSP
jgi:hypothetical protein